MDRRIALDEAMQLSVIGIGCLEKDLSERPITIKEQEQCIWQAQRNTVVLFSELATNNRTELVNSMFPPKIFEETKKAKSPVYLVS